MPEVSSKAKRVWLAMGLYVVAVIVATAVFYWLKQGVGPASPVRYAYALCGPALSLFTHMSYLLFAEQSLVLLPWLLFGALRPQAAKISTAGFALCWLAVGWYTHDVF